MRSDSFSAFFGVEHGSLRALQAAKETGKPGLLAFCSPHHSALSKWVYEEYKRFPSLLTPYKSMLMKKSEKRNERKDMEAKIADFIHAGSSLTLSTLKKAGIDEDKIHVSPLGCPSVKKVKKERGKNVVFAGSVSVEKGAHYLIEAWNKLSCEDVSELHFYGNVDLPDKVIEKANKSIVFHGSVPQEKLFSVFSSAYVLVHPTLLDGFGMVITEAFANGLPVVTTTNAGASDLVEEGENGFIVPPKDSDALAERIDWVLRNPAEVATMREAARDTARSWQWSDFRRTLRSQIDDEIGIP
jgi:glycosyltransferase involved in cell wall biosynthesis